MIRILIYSVLLVLSSSVVLAIVGYLAGITSGSFYTLMGFITGSLIASSYTIPSIEKHRDEG